MRRPVLLAALLALVAATPALAAPPPVLPGEDALRNPCQDPLLALRCPDLTMQAPRDLTVRRVGGVVRLQARNAIVNVGAGPLELRARRSTRTFARAWQVVRRRHGGPAFFPDAGWVYWKAIPGQDHYWKFFRAARFELWTTAADGSPARLVRTGPKLSYCFRDLDRVGGWRRSPRARVFGPCSQAAGRREMRLGTSVGWADVYPASYHENWISVTGLRGCLAFLLRADPLGELVEEREDNNVGARRVLLPPTRGGRVRAC